nr:hypothetical protein [Tanacetum cinerariifolium]
MISEDSAEERIVLKIAKINKIRTISTQDQKPNPSKAKDKSPGTNYLKELAEYDQSTSTDRPIFLNDNEDHPRESPENSFEENVVSKTNQEPPQDSDIHQLIEECSVEVLEQQKQNMEKTMLDLVKICHHKQFLFMHDNEQEVKIVEEQPAERRNLAPILSTKEPENLLSMGYEHLSITPEMESDDVTESNAKNLLPIPSKCEVTSEDKRECDELVCDNHSDTFFDSKIDDDISVYDESFEDIEYVDASVPDPAIVSIKEENVVHREEEDVDLEDISQYDSFHVEIEPNPERLINLVENNNFDSSNDPLLEEVDLFLFDNSIPPGIENFADDPEGDIRFLEELLIDNFILSHESYDSNFEDNPSISRPPPEPPDDNFDLEPEVISAVMEDNDEPDEYFNPGVEIFVSTNNEDVDYFLLSFHVCHSNFLAISHPS